MPARQPKDTLHQTVQVKLRTVPLIDLTNRMLRVGQPLRVVRTDGREFVVEKQRGASREQSARFKITNDTLWANGRRIVWAFAEVVHTIKEAG